MEGTPKSLDPNDYNEHKARLELEYERIYGTFPPAGVTADQLRFAVTDGNGRFKQTVKPESDRARILREQGSLKSQERT